MLYKALWGVISRDNLRLLPLWFRAVFAAQVQTGARPACVTFFSEDGFKLKLFRAWEQIFDRLNQLTNMINCTERHNDPSPVASDSNASSALQSYYMNAFREGANEYAARSLQPTHPIQPNFILREELPIPYDVIRQLGVGQLFLPRAISPAANTDSPQLEDVASELPHVLNINLINHRCAVKEVLDVAVPAPVLLRGMWSEILSPFVIAEQEDGRIIDSFSVVDNWNTWIVSVRWTIPNYYAVAGPIDPQQTFRIVRGSDMIFVLPLKSATLELDFSIGRYAAMFKIYDEGDTHCRVWSCINAPGHWGYANGELTNRAVLLKMLSDANQRITLRSNPSWRIVWGVHIVPLSDQGKHLAEQILTIFLSDDFIQNISACTQSILHDSSHEDDQLSVHYTN